MQIRSLLMAVIVGLVLTVPSTPAQARCDGFSRCDIVKSGPMKRFKSTRGLRQLPRDRQEVVSLIRSMAPGYGVPTWFALRIAKIESGYNPRARGRAGEFGVFQMKCGTARRIGYSGSCSGLLNASTGVRYGLKHLSLAIKSAGGNLRLAASKHNAGLGRKSLVPRYVRMVF